MARSRFTPHDPESIHKRFEQIKARAFQRIEDERKRLTALRVQPPPEPPPPPPPPVRGRGRKPQKRN